MNPAWAIANNLDRIAKADVLATTTADILDDISNGRNADTLADKIREDAATDQAAEAARIGNLAYALHATHRQRSCRL